MSDFTTLKDIFSSSGDLIANTPATVTATTTSTAFYIGDRTDMSIQIAGASWSSGAGKFEVMISNDGTNFTPYQRMVPDATVAAGSTPALVNSVTLNAAGYDHIFFPNGDHFSYLKVRVTVTGTGSYSAILHAQ